MFQTLGVSYAYLCEGIWVIESSPSTPTSHVLIRTSYGPPDIVHPVINEDEMCHGIKCAREWKGMNKRGRHRSYGELCKPSASEFVSCNLSPINNINNPSH